MNWRVRAPSSPRLLFFSGIAERQGQVRSGQGVTHWHWQPLSQTGLSVRGLPSPGSCFLQVNCQCARQWAWIASAAFGSEHPAYRPGPPSPRPPATGSHRSAKQPNPFRVFTRRRVGSLLQWLSGVIYCCRRCIVHARWRRGRWQSFAPSDSCTFLR
jgi:hypothetical protein